MSPQTPGLDIQPDDVKNRRRIGTLGKHGVYHVTCKGGYNLIMTGGQGDGIPKSGVLAAGPHPAVARFVAQKSFPELRITELSKSWADLPREEMQAMLPEARRLSAALWAAEE